MSGIPPQLNTDPGTPSQEWARSTTTTAFARSDPSPHASSTNSVAAAHPRSGDISVSAASDAQNGPFDPGATVTETPSPIPGAYPDSPGEQNMPARHESMAETAQRAAGNASTFVQSAATATAGYLPRGVVDSVSSYIPTSHATSTTSRSRASEHDIEHKTSFPSAEITGADLREHIAGAGTLPGAVNEVGVADLPDERADAEKYVGDGAVNPAPPGGPAALKNQIMSTGENPVSKAANSPSARDANTGPHAPHSTAVTAPTPPAHEPFGAHPGDHSSSAGAHPGNQSEPHVARLPEESARPQYNSGPIDADAQVVLKPTEEPSGNEASRAPENAREERAGRSASEVTKGAGATGVGALLVSRDEGGRQQVRPVTGDSRAEHQTQPQSQSQSPPQTKPQSQTQSPSQPRAEKPQQREDKKGGAPPPTMEQLVAKEVEGGKEKHDQDATAAGGHKGKPNQHESDTLSGDCQTDLLHPTLHPRAHALGGADARWGDEPLSGAGARELAARDPNDADVPLKGPGYQTNYHPADLHPRTDEEPSSPSTQASAREKSLGATQADALRPPEEQPPPHQAKDSANARERERKATFMEKMKGEAKVLLGKVEGKPEKVELGRNLKAGGSPTATQQEGTRAQT